MRRRPPVVVLAAIAFLLIPVAARSQDPETEPPPWWERITFSGDLRSRFEGFYQAERPTRQRARFRLRLGLRTEIRDDVLLGVRLASADPADPTSPNQTLTEFFTRKPLYLDQVFVTYTPTALRGLALGFGKFPYPFTRTEMIWDDDVNWEGGYQQVTLGRAGDVSLRLGAVQSPLNDVADGPDAYMFGEQAQIGVRAGRHGFQIAVANYRYREVDQIAVALAARRLRSQSTNRLRRGPDGAVTGYASRFHLVDIIGQATLATGRPDYPVALTFDRVVNTAGPAGERAGAWVGVAYGRAARRGTYALRYTAMRIERDAVLSAFNSSDLPGTNFRGHVVSGSYMLRERLAVDATGLFSRRIEPGPEEPHTWLARIQMDMRVAF